MQSFDDIVLLFVSSIVDGEQPIQCRCHPPLNLHVEQQLRTCSFEHCEQATVSIKNQRRIRPEAALNTCKIDLKLLNATGTSFEVFVEQQQKAAALSPRSERYCALSIDNY